MACRRDFIRREPDIVMVLNPDANSLIVARGNVSNGRRGHRPRAFDMKAKFSALIEWRTAYSSARN